MRQKTSNEGTIRGRRLALRLVLMLAACKGATVDLDLSGACLDYWCAPQIPQVRIVGPSGPMGVGDTARFKAALFDTLGVALSGRTVQWRSLDNTKATVNATGLVTAVGAGVVEIQATAMPDRISGTRRLTVVSGSAPVASVQLALARSFLLPGETTIATATLRDAQGYVLTGRHIVWSIEDVSVATVGTNGVVTASAPGSTAVRATSEGAFGESPITVTLVPPERTLRLEGIYPAEVFPGVIGIPYSVAGQSAGGVVRGQFAIRQSELYPWINDDVGPLTCLEEVNGAIVAAMYPSVAFGPTAASYIIVKDPHGSPLVYAGGAGSGNATSSGYCNPSALANFINSMPASAFKPGVTLLQFP